MFQWKPDVQLISGLILRQNKGLPKGLLIFLFTWFGLWRCSATDTSEVFRALSLARCVSQVKEKNEKPQKINVKLIEWK